MKFTVLGATGNTGRVVAERLLAAGAEVRAVVRRPDEATLDPRIEVIAGSLEQPENLRPALAGVDGVYLLSPPTPSTDDFVSERRRMFEALSEVLATANVPHTVLLSSVGGQRASGTGVIQTVGNAERSLAAQGLTYTALRAAYFQENWGMALGALSDGILPTMFGPAGLSIPMVATQDIGRAAAELLLAGPNSSQPFVELAGPREYSPQDVADVLGRLTNKSLQVVVVPPEQRASTLSGFGVGADQAELYAQMYAGIEDGTVSWERPQEVKRGKVDLETTLGVLLN